MPGDGVTGFSLPWTSTLQPHGAPALPSPACPLGTHSVEALGEMWIFLYSPQFVAQSAFEDGGKSTSEGAGMASLLTHPKQCQHLALRPPPSRTSNSQPPQSISLCKHSPADKAENKLQSHIMKSSSNKPSH